MPVLLVRGQARGSGSDGRCSSGRRRRHTPYVCHRRASRPLGCGAGGRLPPALRLPPAGAARSPVVGLAPPAPRHPRRVLLRAQPLPRHLALHLRPRRDPDLRGDDARYPRLHPPPGPLLPDLPALGRHHRLRARHGVRRRGPLLHPRLPAAQRAGEDQGREAHPRPHRRRRRRGRDAGPRGPAKVRRPLRGGRLRRRRPDEAGRPHPRRPGPRPDRRAPAGRRRSGGRRDPDRHPHRHRRADAPHGGPLQADRREVQDHPRPRRPRRRPGHLQPAPHRRHRGSPRPRSGRAGPGPDLEGDEGARDRRHRRGRLHRLGAVPADRALRAVGPGARRAGGERPLRHRSRAAGPLPLGAARAVPRRHRRAEADGGRSSRPTGRPSSSTPPPTSTCR